MKKSQFSITLSQFIKLILLILSLQLILFNHAHAEGIRFNRVKYLTDYGFLGIGNNGLTVYSKNGQNWNKVTIAGINPGMDLLDIIDNPRDPSLFYIEALQNGKYKFLSFKVDENVLHYQKSTLITEINSLQIKSNIGIGDELWSCGYTPVERIFTCLVRNLTTDLSEKKVYRDIPEIVNLKTLANNSIALQLKSPYRGSYQLNAKLTSTMEGLGLLKFYPLMAPSTVIFERFAGESYAVNVLDAKHGSVQIFKANTNGTFILSKTIQTGKAISESGMIALPTRSGSLNEEDDDVEVVVSDDGPLGIEIIDYLTGRVNHLPIAPRTCATTASHLEGKTSIEIFLGFDNHALVSFDKGQWRAIPITGL